MALAGPFHIADALPGVALRMEIPWVRFGLSVAEALAYADSIVRVAEVTGLGVVIHCVGDDDAMFVSAHPVEQWCHWCLSDCIHHCETWECDAESSESAKADLAGSASASQIKPSGGLS